MEERMDRHDVAIFKQKNDTYRGYLKQEIASATLKRDTETDFYRAEILAEKIRTYGHALAIFDAVQAGRMV
jgi:hypothetical protein